MTENEHKIAAKEILLKSHKESYKFHKKRMTDFDEAINRLYAEIKELKGD